jgi:hypothetical protein
MAAAAAAEFVAGDVVFGPLRLSSTARSGIFITMNHRIYIVHGGIMA